MNPFRRRLLSTLGSVPLVLGAARVLAQRKVPQAGVEYRLVTPPLPPESKLRVEVIEFFWYGCPHCYAFEPIIEPWIKKLPPGVNFHRVPAAFNKAWVPHAMLYYSLEILGETERLHKTIFDAVQSQQQTLSNETAIADFLEKNGVPRAKFIEAYRSFTVQNNVLRGNELQKAYAIDGVPTMGVDGRFVTSATMVGNSHEAVLPVVDYLIGEARKYHRLPK
jgi:protein dithiol oxidoreductase (disulfide-forming)